MDWKTKSYIMRICSTSSIGRACYRLLQNASGRIKANPQTRLPLFLQMANWLKTENITVKGTTIFEVGTGHLPVVPICFYLCGADKVITCDLNQRLNFNLTQDALNWFHENKQHIHDEFKLLVDQDTFDARMMVISEFKDDAQGFLNKAGIEYRAPADATDTSIEPQSIDIHFSVTVLEHIPDDTIRSIWKEASRILKPTGIAAHFVDLSDHFQHTDNSITRINFLKYDAKQWDTIAGNEYAYCNRLRPSHYINAALDEGATIIRSEATVDLHATESIQNGFTVDKYFQDLTTDEICTRKFNFMFSFSDNNRGSLKESEPTFVYDK